MSSNFLFMSNIIILSTDISTFSYVKLRLPDHKTACLSIYLSMYLSISVIAFSISVLLFYYLKIPSITDLFFIISYSFTFSYFSLYICSLIKLFSHNFRRLNVLFYLLPLDLCSKLWPSLNSVVLWKLFYSPSFHRRLIPSELLRARCPFVFIEYFPKAVKHILERKQYEKERFGACVIEGYIQNRNYFFIYTHIYKFHTCEVAVPLPWKDGLYTYIHIYVWNKFDKKQNKK